MQTCKLFLYRKLSYAGLSKKLGALMFYDRQKTFVYNNKLPQAIKMY